MKMRNRDKKSVRFIKFLPLILAIVVICLTIGYSTGADTLAIGNAKVRLMADYTVRLTYASDGGSTNSGQTRYIEFGRDNLGADISLPNADSTVTFNVEATTLGNTEMGIMEINNLPSNLKYTLTGYNLGAALCDSINSVKCTLGAVTSFQITIEYDTNGYDENNTLYSFNLGFVFQEMEYTARIGTDYYETIQDAINAAPIDNTETTIVVLKNVYQRIQVWRGNNIVLDMPNLVLHNPAYTNNIGDPVIELFGARDKEHTAADDNNNTGVARVKMTNGSIITDANQGAINVERGGEFVMTGGTIITTGNRQAVYIKSRGHAEISGTAYLRAQAEVISTGSVNFRGTVHNAGGTLVITGGTFEAVGTNGIALTSEASTTIGIKDGTVSTTTPRFFGTGTGIYIKQNTNFKFYDGVALGQTNAIFNQNDIDDKETGYDVVYSGETINNNTYLKAYLGNNGVTLTFDPNEGSVDETTRLVAPGAAVGPLPTPTRNGYNFDYWYDSNGIEVGTDSVINTSATYTAHWTSASYIYYARINHGNNQYTNFATLAEAIAAAPNNTRTVIELTRDTIEKVTIGSNKNIVFDFKEFTLSNPDNANMVTNNGTLEVTSGTFSMTGASAVIANNNNLTISGGTFLSTSNNAAAINNNPDSVNPNAILLMTGGKVTTTGNRQAVYDAGATVIISGSVELTSAAKFENSKPRATVQGAVATSNITILSGSIVSTYSSGVAVTNIGTLTLGQSGGGIDTTTPYLRANSKAIYSTGTLNIYDGLLLCKKNTIIDGTITNSEANTQPNTSGRETIDGTTYYKWYLESVS